MEIISNELDWLHTDEQALAAFLETPTGRRLIPKLLEQTPTLLEKGEQNEILIRLGKVAGYQEVARTILLLAHPAPKVADNDSGALPPLENDELWPKPPPEPALDFVEPPPPAPETQTPNPAE